jgi:hypothetical protein
MENISRYLVHHARDLAREVNARAVLVYADAVCSDDALCEILRDVDFPAVLVTRSREAPVPAGLESHIWISVPDVHMTRAGQVKSALLVCLARGILHKDDRVIVLIGVDGSSVIDSLGVLHLGTEQELLSGVGPIDIGGDVAPEVFERVLTLSTQLAAEGREGRPVGVLFVLGDCDRVLSESRSLVLNPFRGHPESERNILDPMLEETIKEFSALDGAFVVRGDGVVLTAGTHLMPAAAADRLQGGLGTRHAAAADITHSTKAVAVCVSQSTGTVAIFKSGKLITDIPRPTNGPRPSIRKKMNRPIGRDSAELGSVA